MRRFRTRSVIVAAAAAAALIASPLAIQPASAIPANGSVCTFVAGPTGVTSAQISWYPGQPGSQSGLEVGCVFRHDSGENMTSPSFTIHDAGVITYHNGAAKPVRNTAVVAVGSTTIQLNTAANGIVGLPVAPTQMNRVITGAGIGPRTFVKSMTAGGLITLSKPTVDSNPAVVGAQTMPINTDLRIDNAIARNIDDATRTAPDLINSTQANFTAADVGLSVSGTGIPANTSIAAIITPTQAQLSNAFASTSTVVTIGASLLVSTHRQITGATITSAVRVVSPTGLGSFVASDIGLPVTGVCTQLTASIADDYTIPANVMITATPSQANADTTGGLTFPQSGCTIQVGVATGNAPGNGEVVANQGVQLDLNPALVAGSGDCADEQPEGFSIQAKWYNAEDFQGSGATNEQPGPTVASPALPGTKAVGQLVFDNSAADFSAFIIERKALTAGDPNAAVHYDIVFPFVPTGLALCPVGATTPGLSFLLDVEAIAANQSSAATGTGRPGTGQVRNVSAQPSGGYVASVIVDSQATPFTPQSSFSRTCVYPAGLPNPTNFQCGAG